MGFKDLNISIRYRSDMNNIPRDFLIPVLNEAVLYCRGTGFFSTSSLAELTVGIAGLVKNGGKIRVVCSPILSKEDIEAIELGYENREKVISNAMINSLIPPIDEFEEERLNLLANLVAQGVVDFKIAFMETATNRISQYHEKLAVFVDKDGNKISYNGSMNETFNGISENFESFYTFCSWKDISQKEGCFTIENDFERLWNDETDKLKIIPFPKLVAEKLLEFQKREPDYNIDDRQFAYNDFLKSQLIFHVPDAVDLRTYQKEAISSWVQNGFKGIFSMCTGSGKTYTALACMEYLARKLEEKLAVFIVCPYIHLVSQWEEDVINWGPQPIICHSKSPNKNWRSDMSRAYRRFRNGGKAFICITTLDTYTDEDIQQFMRRFEPDDNVLLIVDEAHNFGSPQMIEYMPYNVQYRIALSATIKRHMDKTGTKKLFDYFGDICISYELEDAISDGNLVHYEYYPLPVYLSDDELDKYINLTNKLKKYLIIKNGKVKVSEAGKTIVYERTRLLAGAENKIPLLLDRMSVYGGESNILVYCGAASVMTDEGEDKRQIDYVTEKLQTELGMSVRRFTAEESLIERQNIKKYFAQGLYQVVTAIRCLDEGVNIPGISKAFIMSSSRNPKEFVQRRGRLLRTAPGKEKAIIFDFVTLPRDIDCNCTYDYETDKSIILGEMYRIREFAKLADNPEISNSLCLKIMEAYDTYVDVEKEVEAMEDYYSE